MNYKICWKENADFCNQIIQEINTVRHKPCAFAPYLQQYIDDFEDGCVLISHIAEDGKTEEEVGVELEEGKQVLQEALQFLVGHPGMLKPMSENEFLHKAVYDHYLDIAPKGLTQHKSSDGKSTYKDRIEKHCVWGGAIFEAIQYGQRRTHARDYVLSWIIDDGFENRIHRKHIFQSEIQEIALIAGPHERTEFCVIAKFATQILTKEEAKIIEDKNREKQAIEYRKKMMQEKNWEQFAKDVFKLQNKVRTNPKSFIGHLEKCLGRFKGLVLYSEDNKSFIETKEGPSAYVEAIEFLRNRRGMKQFEWSDKLEKAGKEFVNDIGPKGLVSSLGSDGSLPTDRINKYGTIDETWGESNIYGGLNSKEVIERLLVCDGQPTRGFRTNLFNDQLLLCGVATGLHASHDNMIQIEYVKGLLEVGEAPTITVQIEDDVPKETVDKLISMGIDKKRLKICHDPRSNEKKIQSLISVPVNTAKMQMSPQKSEKKTGNRHSHCHDKQSAPVTAPPPKQQPVTVVNPAQQPKLTPREQDSKLQGRQAARTSVTSSGMPQSKHKPCKSTPFSDSTSQFIDSQRQKIQQKSQVGALGLQQRPMSTRSNQNSVAASSTTNKVVRKPLSTDTSGKKLKTVKPLKSPKEILASKMVISPNKVNYETVKKERAGTQMGQITPGKLGSKTTPTNARKSVQHNFAANKFSLSGVKDKIEMPRKSVNLMQKKNVNNNKQNHMRNYELQCQQYKQETTLDTTKDNSSQFSNSMRKSAILKQRKALRSPQPESGPKNLHSNRNNKPPINNTLHGHTRSNVISTQKNAMDRGKIQFDGMDQEQRKKSFIGKGSNHVATMRSSNQASENGEEMQNGQRNPILLLNPQNTQNNENKSTNRNKDLDDDFLYKTYDSKSNQEVFSDKMNLQQQETNELVDETAENEKEPMEYEQFLEILDQSANNITPRNEMPGLQTPISPTSKFGLPNQSMNSTTNDGTPVIEMKQNISMIKNDRQKLGTIPSVPSETQVLDQSYTTEFSSKVMAQASLQKSEEDSNVTHSTIRGNSITKKKERRPRSSRKETPKKPNMTSVMQGSTSAAKNGDHRRLGSFAGMGMGGMPADCDDFIKQLNEKESMQSKSRAVPYIENQGSTFNPIKTPGSPSQNDTDLNRVSYHPQIQSTIRNKTTASEHHYRDSINSFTNHRPSISATPQFATPAAGEQMTDRESKMSIHGTSAASSNASGIFTSSPEKNVNKSKKPVFDMDNDPDRPHDAINQSVIIEEIDINGSIQKVHKKTYQLINGQTKVVTRIMHH